MAKKKATVKKVAKKKVTLANGSTVAFRETPAKDPLKGLTPPEQVVTMSCFSCWTGLVALRRPDIPVSVLCPVCGFDTYEVLE